jgi:hypothetical protein
MNKGWQQHARERWMVGLTLSVDPMAGLPPSWDNCLNALQGLITMQSPD